jgi:hypothetical protein
VAGEEYRSGWGRLDDWHRFHARELQRDLVTVREIAVLRDASPEDLEAIQIVAEMAERLGEKP